MRVKHSLSTVSKWCEGIDPKAKARQQAREMRKKGKPPPEIAKAIGYSIPTIRKWCKGINPKAYQELEAKRLDKEGKTLSEIAAAIGKHPETVKKLLGNNAKKGKKIRVKVQLRSYLIKLEPN